jgi:hypothetical protein
MLAYSESKIVGGGTADVAPGSAPASARFIQLPDRLPGLDMEPVSLRIGILGTAGNSAVVTIWHCVDDPRIVEAGSRRWVTVQTAVTLTANTITRVKACPGLMYVQVTTNSAADSTLVFRGSSESVGAP